MAVTYFGNNDSGTSNKDIENFCRFLVAGYSCPGAGAQNVVTLDVNIATLAAGQSVRMAIYLQSDHSFIAQWDSEIEPGSTGWLAGTSFVDQGGTPIATVQLTGGTDYILALCADGLEVEAYMDTVTSGLAKYIASDYTGGFPDPLPVGSDTSREFCVRCGVEPAAGGIAIPVVMLQHDHFGGGQL